MDYPDVPTPTGWGLLAMALGVLLFIGLWIAGYVSLGRRGPRRRTEHRKAAQLLADHLARGQIDQREYEELSARLDSIPAQRNRRSAHRPGHSRAGR